MLGQDGGYKMVVGAAKMVGLLAQLFSQGWVCKVLGEVVEVGLDWPWWWGGTQKPDEGVKMVVAMGFIWPEWET